jgi:hypothetical protein
LVNLPADARAVKSIRVIVSPAPPCRAGSPARRHGQGYRALGPVQRHESSALVGEVDAVAEERR